MQDLAVDSRGPAAAAAANDTFPNMFRRLTGNAALAERAGPALTGFKCYRKSARKFPEADVEPEIGSIREGFRDHLCSTVRHCT